MEWTRGPDLSTGRQNHACSLVTNQDGGRDIVVVGGLSRHDSQCGQRSDIAARNDVDIINLDSHTRRSGKEYWKF